MGMTLGLIGGGGSILTVPILVYLFHVEPVMATAYSLFIVGITSLIGSIPHFNTGNVHRKAAVIFGIPSIASVYITRAYLVPLIPDPVFTVGDFALTKALALLLFFALLMTVAAYSMIKTKPVGCEEDEIRFNYPLILLEGAVVGIITGLVGAGGGFLIIPALVLLSGICIKKAVGTSLLIIAAKSLIGFLGDMQTGTQPDWKFLAIVSGLAVLGSGVGFFLSNKVSNDKLKPAFGWFILAMGIFIIVKESLQIFN